MIDVVCYGIVCLDYIWRVPRLPEPGGGARILEEATLIGGEAVNTACALQAWGVRVALVLNAVGTDERGVQLRAMMEREFSGGHALVMPIRSDVTTGWCTCIATDDGHRTMFGMELETPECPPLDPELAASAHFFTIDSRGCSDSGREATVVAARHGAKVVAMDCSDSPEVCDLADTLQVSADPFGEEGADDEEVLAWAIQKRDAHDVNVIVTRGPRGCVAAARTGETHMVPAYPLELVVDSTGSGDAFRAGYLYGRLQGWDLRRCLQFASAAAHFNCGAMGGCGGIAPLETILARIDAG